MPDVEQQVSALFAETQSRSELLHAFASHCDTTDAILVLLHAITGDRNFAFHLLAKEMTPAEHADCLRHLIGGNETPLELEDKKRWMEFGEAIGPDYHEKLRKCIAFARTASEFQ